MRSPNRSTPRSRVVLGAAPSRCPYVEKGVTWDHYRPAYRYGVTSAAKRENENETFEEMESRLAQGLGPFARQVQLDLEQARPAVQDAYDRAIKLHEERLHVNKESVNAGDVKIHKDVITEQKTVKVPVEREEVVIERRPAHCGASAMP